MNREEEEELWPRCSILLSDQREATCSILKSHKASWHLFIYRLNHNGKGDKNEQKPTIVRVFLVLCRRQSLLTDRDLSGLEGDMRRRNGGRGRISIDLGVVFLQLLG